MALSNRASFFLRGSNFTGKLHVRYTSFCGQFAGKAVGNFVHAALELFQLLQLKARSYDAQAVADPGAVLTVEAAVSHGPDCPAEGRDHLVERCGRWTAPLPCCPLSPDLAPLLAGLFLSRFSWGRALFSCCYYSRGGPVLRRIRRPRKSGEDLHRPTVKPFVREELRPTK
jgi:hypothetical protein